MDSGGLYLTFNLGALIGIPLLCVVTVLVWRSYKRLKRIEKMMLHQRYTSPESGLTYYPALDHDDSDPDVRRIKDLREQRRKELKEMGITE